MMMSFKKNHFGYFSKPLMKFKLYLNGLNSIFQIVKFVHVCKSNKNTVPGRHDVAVNPLGTGDLTFYQSQGLSTFWDFSFFLTKPFFYMSW